MTKGPSGSGCCCRYGSLLLLPAASHIPCVATRFLGAAHKERGCGLAGAAAEHRYVGRIWLVDSFCLLTHPTAAVVATTSETLS